MKSMKRWLIILSDYIKTTYYFYIQSETLEVIIDDIWK
jgi:hypothetical protein